MNLAQQSVFLLSALGAFNGFLLSGYFLLIKRERRLSDYFLGGLLLMLSIRIFKSVFLFFNPALFQLFVQIGLSACLLIGPFLYLYVLSMVRHEHHLQKRWWGYLLPFGLLIAFLAYQYPYTGPPNHWGPFVPWIYRLWLLCIIASAYQMRQVFTKLWVRDAKLNHAEIWLLNVVLGTTIIYLAYQIASYTSYIVGALSFSFVFYLSVLLQFYQRNRRAIASDPPLKYAKSAFREADLKKNMADLARLMESEKPYLDPELSLAKLSEILGISRKELSQTINQHTGSNYSQYIASLRVAEAQKMLRSQDYKNYKIASIAFECGFNSLSSFNAAFKKISGTTPKAFQSELPTN
ncbi:MAG: helix-turn-helix transcriptional regulator [Bacteroidota bacterium]